MIGTECQKTMYFDLWLSFFDVFLTENVVPWNKRFYRVSYFTKRDYNTQEIKVESI